MTPYKYTNSDYFYMTPYKYTENQGLSDMMYESKSLSRALYDTLQITGTISTWYITYKQKIKGISDIK